jgi:hypothetical protein
MVKILCHLWIIYIIVIFFADLLNYWWFQTVRIGKMKVVPLIILANFFLGIYTNLLFGTNWLTRRTLSLYFIVGAIITLALNFLLIPTMSYYIGYSDNCCLWSMMSIPTIWGTNIIPFLRFKENRGYLAIHTFFSRIILWFQRELCWIGLLIVFLFYLSQWKVTLMKIIKG